MRIFFKNLIIYLLTFTVAFVLLGFLLAAGIRRTENINQTNRLFSLAGRVSHFTENFWAFGGRMNLLQLEQEIVNINNYTGSSVAVLDTEFNILAAHGFPAPVTLDYFTQESFLEALSAILSGRITSFESASYSPLAGTMFVGYPIFVGLEFSGIAIVGHSLAELEFTIAAMLRSSLFALGVAAIPVIIIIWFSSQAISLPLKRMSEAAKKIAGGDFDKRLPAKGAIEIAELANQFNKMAESLQDQENTRQDFLANLSHDIRTPLTSMQGFLTAIQDGTAAQDDVPYYIGIALEESSRLIKLTNDILELHKLQNSQINLNITSFDINALIRTIIGGFKVRATEKKLTVESKFIAEKTLVSGDEEKIRRVLYNLIDNGVKFVEESGQITIETSQGKDGVIISVRDNGKGLSLKEEKHIFERFYKSDSTRNVDKSGFGLGLSIARFFVLAHGSDLILKNTPGKGCEFSFLLCHVAK